MAGFIKGITIEFGADTTKLNTALKKTQGTLNKTQAELKQINRALKFNPGNTTLLKQKFDLLKQSVNQTEEKLKQLRAMEKSMNAAGVDKNSAQYRQLQREIIKTENNLKQAQNELKRFGTVGQQQVVALGNKMKTLGTNVASVGRNLTTHLSMPITLVGGMAGRTAAEFDSAMSKVQAVSGATGSQLEALRDKAREMGASTKFSATESAEALDYMAMAGWKTEDMLSGLEGIMNLAAASGEDLATTSDIVTDALTAFGLTAADSGHFADVLAAASSNANTNVGMMGETFKYAAPIAGALGYSVEDTAEAIGLMANAGIKSTQAGTSLRSIMTKLSKDFTISGEKIGDVTIATTNADGSMRSLNDILADSRKAFAGLTESEKASAAESLVGKNAMSGFLALMNASPKDIQKLESALGNADGAAEQMADTMMDNFGGQLTILKSQLSEAGIAIGETLTPFISKLVTIVQALVDKFNALSPTTQRIIVVLGIVAAAIGPVVTVIGVLMGALGSILTFAPMIATAVGAIGGAFSVLVGPVGIVVAAIAAAIAIGIALYKNWGTIKKWASKTWTAIKNAIMSPVRTVVNTVKTNFNTLKTGLSTAWTTIKNTATKVWGNIKKAITKPIGDAKDKVSKVVEAIKDFFPLKLKKLVSFSLPTISIGSKSTKVGDKNVKSPTFGVGGWKHYAKAANNPYLFRRPTGIIVGDAAQDEIVYGRNSLLKDISQAVGGASLNGTVINVYGSNNMDVNELALAVEQRIITMQKRRSAAWA